MYRISWFQFIKQLPISSHIRPGTSVIAIMIAWSLAVLTLLPFTGAVLAYLLVFPLSYLMLWATKWVTGRTWFTSVPELLSSLVAVLLIFVTPIPGSMAAFLLVPGLGTQVDALVGGTLSFFDTTMLIAVAVAVYSRSHKINTQINNEERQLDILVPRIRTLIWHRRGRIARALHGPIQAELIAAAASQRGSTNNDKLNFDPLLDRLHTILDANDSVDIESEVTQAASLWSERCAIEFDVQPRAMEILRSDAAIADLCTSIVQDAISNSITHGNAQRIKINVTTHNLGIQVVVEDNGGAMSSDGQNAREGLGTIQLRACAISWERSISPDHARLVAVLPTRA